MPAVFGSPNPLSNPDIDWNPPTGTTSNWELPSNRNGGRNETWGHSVGTYPSDNHPFRDPFPNSHHRQSRSASHQRSSHSRSYSAGGEQHGNMNGFMNGNRDGGFLDSRRFRDIQGDDDEEDEDEDEPFYPDEDDLSTPGMRPPHLNSHAQAYPHPTSLHPQYPQYPAPHPWAMYPPYPVAPGAYQQTPYGYPHVPPHSNTTSNAAFFNTGKNVPKKKKVVHRRQSADDLEFFPGPAAGNGYDDNVRDGGWGGGGDDGGRGSGGWGNFDPGRYGRDNEHTSQRRRRGSVDTRGNFPDQGWQNFTKENRLDNSPIEFSRPQGDMGYDNRRHVSAPNWGNPNQEDDLEPGEIRINANGNVTSDWGATQGTDGGTTWGIEDDDDADSPGWETLNRGIADMRLDQHRSHQQHIPHRRHESSPPELIDAEFGAVGRKSAPVWGSASVDNTEPAYTQSYINGGGRHVNIVPNRADAFANHLPDPPRRAEFQYREVNSNGHYPAQEGGRRGESSSSSSYTLGTPNTATWNAYEDQRRQGYADAFTGGNGSGSGFSIGGSVASQLKEKAMKLLRAAGIGSITLHPLLRSPTMLRPTVLSWDVRRIPHPARAGIPVGEAMGAFSEPASKPGLQHMRLIVPIPGLQGAFWHFDVYPNTEELHGKNTFTFGGSPTSFGKTKSQRKKDSFSSAYGEYDNLTSSYPYDEYAVIRCTDILSALSRMLHRSASSNDYHALPKIRQQQVYHAFMRRCGEMEDPASGRLFAAHSDKNKNTPEVNERYQRTYNNGLKRIDFLSGRTKWEGLESNGVDAWTVRLGKTVMK